MDWKELLLPILQAVLVPLVGLIATLVSIYFGKMINLIKSEKIKDFIWTLVLANEQMIKGKAKGVLRLEAVRDAFFKAFPNYPEADFELLVEAAVAKLNLGKEAPKK